MDRFDLTNYKGGFQSDTKDVRDYKWDLIFGSSTPVSIPDSFEIENLPLIAPIQAHSNSCVSCSFSYVEAFKQIKEYKKDFDLSWRYIWANTPHTQSGSTFRDNAKTCQEGIASTKTCPNFENKLKEWIENPDNITEEARAEAPFNRIKNYQYVSWLDFRRALYRGEPLIIAVGGNQTDWNGNNVRNNNYIIDQEGQQSHREWLHAIVVVGYRKVNGHFIYKFRNWWGDDWGDNGFAWLKNPDILSIISVEDIIIKRKNMKFVKLENENAVYLIKGNNAYPISSGDDYLNLEEDFSVVEEIKNFDGYTKVDSKLYVFVR